MVNLCQGKTWYGKRTVKKIIDKAADIIYGTITIEEIENGNVD